MWRCRICEKKTKKRANIVRHLKLIHGIDDIDFKSVIKDTNIGVESYETDRSQVCSNELQSRMIEKGRPLSEDYGEIPYKVSLQSNMLGSGIPLSEDRYSNMNSPKRLLRNERHSLRQQPRAQEYDDSEEEENFENEKRYQNLPDQELTEERIDEIYGDLKAKKRRILDSVLKTIPDHLQTRAKRFCDALKCKDRLFILPNGCLNIDGKTLGGSHIRRLIMQEVEEPPTPGSIQYKLLEDEKKTIKHLLKNQVKALARATGLSRIRKFESLDGTIEYFDYSDDTNSDDSNDEEDEDGTNEIKDCDEDDDTDGTEKDEDDEEESTEASS